MHVVDKLYTRSSTSFVVDDEFDLSPPRASRQSPAPRPADINHATGVSFWLILIHS